MLKSVYYSWTRLPPVTHSAGVANIPWFMLSSIRWRWSCNQVYFNLKVRLPAQLGAWVVSSVFSWNDLGSQSGLGLWLGGFRSQLTHMWFRQARCKLHGRPSKQIHSLCETSTDRRCWLQIGICQCKWCCCCSVTIRVSARAVVHTQDKFMFGSTQFQVRSWALEDRHLARDSLFTEWKQATHWRGQHTLPQKQPCVRLSTKESKMISPGKKPVSITLHFCACIRWCKTHPNNHKDTCVFHPGHSLPTIW